MMHGNTKIKKIKTLILSLISLKVRQTMCMTFHPHRKPTDPYKARFPEPQAAGNYDC